MPDPFFPDARLVKGLAFVIIVGKRSVLLDYTLNLIWHRGLCTFNGNQKLELTHLSHLIQRHFIMYTFKD